MKYTDLSVLKIHKMSQEQYEREKAAGNINENEIYLTPDDDGSTDESLVGTWVFNETLTFEGVEYNVSYPINFTTLGTSETLESIIIENNKYGVAADFLSYSYTHDDGSGGSYTAYASEPVVWLSGGWDNEAYRTVTIYNEIDDGWFKTWFRANAKKQEETLNTESKTIIGAINELHSEIGDISTALDSIITQTESILGGNS